MDLFMPILGRRPRKMPKTKKEKLIFAFRIFIIILGSFLVSFGNVAFLVPLNINSGGLSGIGIIVRYFISDPNMKVLAYNLVVDIASVILWIVGFIFIGKEFALKTLVATIAFPVANWLFTACPGISNGIVDFGELIKTSANGPTAGNYLLAGLFGGAFIGSGVAITFVGGGSTGGVDVITFLAERYLKIKQSTASFIVDGSIVVAGLLIILPRDQEILLPCLTGVISAFLTAIFIEVIYIGLQSGYQVDIISSKWEDISKYVQDDLERGATVIHAKGGFRGDERIILRVVIASRQHNALRSFIAKTDPKAFVTYTRTNAVFGEGFKPHKEENEIEKFHNRKNGKK